MSLQPAAPHRTVVRTRVAMALYGDLTHDSRVLREAQSLARHGYEVTIVCLAASPATVDRLRPDVRVVVCGLPGAAVAPGAPNPFRGATRRALRSFDRAAWLWRYRSSLRWWGREIVAAVGPVDVWHAHDLTGLAAVVPNVHPRIAVVYDSHELYLETGTPARLAAPARFLLRRHEAALVRRCAAVITVNPGLAAVLERQYRPRRVQVVRNCAYLWEPSSTRPDLIRSAFGIPPSAPILLFHGGLEPNRGIEVIVAAITAPGLEDLHVVLLGNGQLRPSLEERARDRELADRLHLLPPVAPQDLPEWVASADLAAVLQQPADLNLVLSTPNKLFESIAVGTPVLAADLPEIRRIVIDPDGPLGVVCDPQDPEAVTAALRSLLAPPRRTLSEMRARCRDAARTRLNWEAEAGHLLAVYETLSSHSQPVAGAAKGT